MSAGAERAVEDAASRCQVCDGPELREVDGYPALRRVSSDCRSWPAGGRLAVCMSCGTVQKVATRTWRQECRDIYADYVVYRQGPKAEQSVFLSGVAESRSRLFLGWVMQKLGSPAGGRALDFGCGDGALLRNLASMAPAWRLSGQDLNTRYRDAILALPGVEAFHTVAIDELPAGFDLVTAVHVIEHLERPADCLRALAGKLAPAGTLAIEVPDVVTSPFDLLVVDHVTHFTRKTLSTLLAKAGLVAVARSDSLAPKELSTIARQGSIDGVPEDAGAEEAVALVERHLAWLSRLRDAAAAASARGEVAIFGTAIAGTWLYGELDHAPVLFVDEDSKRHRHLHFGRKIVPPADVPKHIPVIVPLPAEVAPGVIGRLQALGLSTVWS